MYMVQVVLSNVNRNVWSLNRLCRLVACTVPTVELVDGVRMANFLLHGHEMTVGVPEAESGPNFTRYVVSVALGAIRWTAMRRYSDFCELHDRLVSDHGVSRDILPPKKVLGNRDPRFVEKRRAALHVYLGGVTHFLQRAMPRELALFLDMHKYEIVFMLQELALRLFQEGDTLLQLPGHFVFSPLQLHAISERLKLPHPPLEGTDKRLDFSHVLDFCCRLSSVKVRGSASPEGTSNIIPNELNFELSSLKLLERLWLENVRVEHIHNVGNARGSVVTLVATRCELTSVAEVLLCDQIHRELEPSLAWGHVVEADFSHNALRVMDDAMTLLPNIEHLTLTNNLLCEVDHLSALPHLSHLDLSRNHFMHVADLHTKLGNVRYIDLSQNYIVSLAGFSRLFSLEGLDLTSNGVTELQEVRHLTGLPCLEHLVLTGNPVATTVDYRVRVLEQFGSRAPEVCLDNEKSTQKELDTVAVLQAIRTVKEGRSPVRCDGVVLS